MAPAAWGWPDSEELLAALQRRLAVAARGAASAGAWEPLDARPLLGGCFVVHPRHRAGPGHQGDRAWAAAVAWRPPLASGHPRRMDRHLRGAPPHGEPRTADDVLAQHVETGRSPAAYVPGALALRVGPLLSAALAGLGVRPDLVLVDASGPDHPRGAGLAVHLGAAAGLPTVGVTRRPLVAEGAQPALRRGATSPLRLGGRCVAYWVCTRSGARPLVAHAGWRTTPETAAEVAVLASTPAARTPVPLQEARRAAREARDRAARP